MPSSPLAHDKSNPARRSVLTAAAWAAPVVAVAAASPLAAASTLNADLRLSFSESADGPIKVAEADLPVTYDSIEALTDTLLALNPGNQGADENTLDNQLYWSWLDAIDSGMDPFWTSMGSGSFLLASAYLEHAITTVEVHSLSSPIDAGTMVGAQYTAAGWTLEGANNLEDTVFTATPGSLTVNRTLPASVTEPGTSIFGDIALSVTATESHTVSFGAAREQSVDPTPVAGSIVTLDSDATGNSAATRIYWEQGIRSELRDLILALANLVGTHNGRMLQAVFFMWNDPSPEQIEAYEADHGFRPDIDLTNVDLDAIKASPILSFTPTIVSN